MRKHAPACKQPDDSFKNRRGRSHFQHENRSTWVNDYVTRMDLPGTDPNGIYVQAEGGLLSITAERKTEEDGSGY